MIMKLNGFTFLEVLITMGILGIIFAIGLPVGLDFYQRYQFDSEASLFISLLESTRNSAMVNLNESSHGVYIDTDDFVIFQGASYAARDTSQDQNFPRSGSMSVSPCCGGLAEIVFSALSGQTASSTFTISHLQKSININVNAEGTISY